MLKKLKIQNFRSIVDAELTFSKINLFIGPNGGGKSNVLEAIGVVSAALGRSIEPIDLDRRGVRLSLPRLFKSTFKKRDIPKGFSITAETERTAYTARIIAGERSEVLHFSHESVAENGQKIVGRAPRGIKLHRPAASPSNLNSEISILFPDATRGVYDTCRNLIVLSAEARDELDHLASYVIYAPQTAILRGTATDPRTIEPLGLTGGRLAAAIQEVLRNLTNLRKSKNSTEVDRIDRCLSIIWEAGWPDRLSVRRPLPEVVPPQVATGPKVLYFRDRYMQTKRNLLSAFDASEGTLYLLFVATLLAHPRAPRIFALDNVDGTLNPSLVRKLVEHIIEILTTVGEEDRQVFLTSHNPTALDALDIFSDDHRVYVVRRNSRSGQTEFMRVKPPKDMTRADWIKLQKGRNTSVLWLEGFIEGALNEL